MSKYFQKKQETELEKNGRKKGVERSVFLFYVVAACLMFVLGLAVGRGTAPFQYDIPNIELKLQEVLTGLEKETLQKKDDLGFYDQLKVDVGEPEIPPAETKVEAGAGAVETKTEVVETPARKVKTILARSSAEKKRMPPKGSEMVPASASSERAASPETRSSEGSGKPGKWTIQVAAFSNPDEAELTAKKYKAKGYDAYVVESLSDSGKTWYRFRVGRFPDRAAAVAVQKKLAADGARDAYILQAD